MTVQYSIQKMVSDGTLSTIALGIQYLQRNDIYIRIAGEETPQSGAPSGYTWSFINNTTLKILPVVPNGIEVLVYRRTDVDAMYNIYSQNAQFDEATIDENNQQLLYIAQEYLEQGIPGAGIANLEYVHTVGGLNYYRFQLTDGSYTATFSVPDGTVMLRSDLASLSGTQLVGYSGVLSLDDRIRITGVSPSDREWNCTALTTDCATQIEEAWLKAQELKTNLILPKKYKVRRMLDMNCPSYFVGSEIIGNGKWATGIEYTGAADIDGLLDFRTVPGSTITTLGIRNAGFWGNRKTDSLMSSLNGFAFTDLKIDNNLFNGGKVANLDIAAFVATIGNNYFRDGDGIGARIRDKPVGWVGGYQNTTLFYHNNYALWVANGHDIRNVGYSEILANACDGESVHNAYTLVNVNGAFRNNGSERARRYGNFTGCVLSEFSGYAAYMGIGLPGETIDSLMYFDGGCDINWTGFNDLDTATQDATYTNQVRVTRGHANMDIRINCGGVRPSHFGLFGTPAVAARNPRGVRFANDQRYSSKEAGGNFMGGAVFNEYSGVVNDLASTENPVSKSSMSFYLPGSVAAQVRLSNFPVSSITKTNAAMFVVRVRGMHKFTGETFEYIAHAGYANNGAFSVSYTTVKARTGGSPFTLSDSSGYIALNKNTSTGADCLFIVEIEAVAAGGVTSAAMSIGRVSPFF